MHYCSAPPTGISPGMVRERDGTPGSETEVGVSAGPCDTSNWRIKAGTSSFSRDQILFSDDILAQHNKM